jgi:hypothetical protein
LYAVDRAGNKSEIIPVPVKPLEPAFSRVAKSLIVKAGFASFFVDWTNELKQNLNVYADFTYTEKGVYKEQRLIYTSNLPVERWFIRDLELTAQEPINVKIRVEDPYGNITELIDKGQITLLEDELIPKDKWIMPENDGNGRVDSVGGVPMAFLAGYEGRSGYLIDGIIDDGVVINYTHTAGRGRTGLSKDGDTPWNVMIDLGDEYEISRIITHQRSEFYYLYENVGVYAMYIWDDIDEKWDSIGQNKILFPKGMSPMETRQLGLAGDMAYLYPDDPKFAKKTRWFRYEALHSFDDNYTATYGDCLSEITLYGKKK